MTHHTLQHVWIHRPRLQISEHHTSSTSPEVIQTEHESREGSTTLRPLEWVSSRRPSTQSHSEFGACPGANTAVAVPPNTQAVDEDCDLTMDNGGVAISSDSPAESATKDVVNALATWDIPSGIFPWEDDTKSLELRTAYFKAWRDRRSKDKRAWQDAGSPVCAVSDEKHQPAHNGGEHIGEAFRAGRVQRSTRPFLRSRMKRVSTFQDTFC
jgi:hypothetical protein